MATIQDVTDAQADEIANACYNALRKTGFNGGMGGLTWDRALVRAAIAQSNAQTEALLYEHEDGRYAVNPDTVGDPKWHRLGPVAMPVRADSFPVAWSRTRYIYDNEEREIGLDEPEICWTIERPDGDGWLALFAECEGWQMIGTAPKDGKTVLIANDVPGSIHPREGYYVLPEHRYENEPKHEGWWRLAGSCEERVCGRTPTHWMPMPDGPAPRHDALQPLSDLNHELGLDP